MSGFHPIRTSGGAANKRCYVVGKLPSSSVTADRMGSEPAFTRRRSRVDEWAQIYTVGLLKPFEQFDTVPAGDAMLDAYELPRAIRDEATRLMVNELKNVL